MKTLNLIKQYLAGQQRLLNQKEISTWLKSDKIDYKSIWSTKKESIIEIKKINEEIRDIQHKRINYNFFLKRNKENNLNYRFLKRKKDTFKAILENNLRFPENDHLNSFSIDFANDYTVKIDKELDWNFYARSCNKPANIYTINIEIPENWSKKNIEVSKFDGLKNVYCKKIRTINNINVYAVIYLKQKKGYDFSFEKSFVASNNKYSYHADSIKTAIIGLRKKIKRHIKKHFLTLEQEITKSMYHEITGACMSGINAFCDAHDLTDKKSIKVKDLIPLLEIKKSYGLTKIKESIISEETKQEMIKEL
jgi:ribosomal protein L31E